MDHSQEIRQAYSSYQAERTLRLGWILAAIGIPSILFFALTDFFVLELSISQSLLWRIIGVIPMVLFLFLARTRFRANKKEIIPFHTLVLTCIVLMISGLAFIIFDMDYQSDLFNRKFGVTSGYLLVILGVFVLSGGAKKDYKYFVGIPILVLMVALLINQKMEPVDWGMVTNILIGGAVTIVLAHQQSKAEFREFELQKKLEISEEEVRQHRNFLQKKVEERTAELKDARDHAEAMSNLKTIMLSNLTHELRTPAGSIRSLVDLVRLNPSEEELAAYTDMLQESSNRLLSTLENTIRFSELESGIIKPEWEEIKFHDLLVRVCKDHEAAMNHKGLTLIIPEDQGFTTLSDGQILRQILNNLLDNAVKFTSSGEIEISYLAQENNFTWSVRDTGKGISADALPYITDSFRQGSEGLNRHHQGMGLGLAMVKGYLNILGGELHIESEENKGSVFTCVIPLQERVS